MNLQVKHFDLLPDAYAEALSKLQDRNELDYKKEAINLGIFKQYLKAFRNIIIPNPIPDYTTSRVLTMELELRS